MLYYALFDYSDRRVQERDYGKDTKENVAVFTMVVNASSESQVRERLKRKLIALHEESELFYDVAEVFLDDIVAIDDISPDGDLVHWMSVVSFGDGHASFIQPVWDDGQPDAKSAHDDGMKGGEDDFKEPFIDFSRDLHVTRPLFKDLLRRKERGTLMPFEELSDGDLYALFVHEKCLDKEITNLFDIPLHRERYRRRKVGASITEEALIGTLKATGIMEPDEFPR